MYHAAPFFSRISRWVRAVVSLVFADKLQIAESGLPRKGYRLTLAESQPSIMILRTRSPLRKAVFSTGDVDTTTPSSDNCISKLYLQPSYRWSQRVGVNGIDSSVGAHATFPIKQWIDTVDSHVPWYGAVYSTGKVTLEKYLDCALRLGWNTSSSVLLRM